MFHISRATGEIASARFRVSFALENAHSSRLNLNRDLSAFSFLGVGVNPPTPSWGNMISDGLRVWTNYPHLLVAPAAILAVVTVAFNFLGDGLNDALNPKGQK